MSKRSRRSSRRTGGSVFSFIDGNYDDCICDSNTGKVLDDPKYSPKKDKSPSPTRNPTPEKDPSPLPQRTWATCLFGQKTGGRTMKKRSRRRKSIRIPFHKIRSAISLCNYMLHVIHNQWFVLYRDTHLMQYEDHWHFVSKMNLS